MFLACNVMIYYKVLSLDELFMKHKKRLGTRGAKPFKPQLKTAGEN